MTTAMECECDDEVAPGACPGFNDRDEIQACNTCQRFTYDEDAAQAIAELVGGLVAERHEAARDGGVSYLVVVAPDGSVMTSDDIRTVAQR